MFDFLKNLSLTEIIIIAAILLVLFGGKKVKELSRGLGESSKELKKVKREFESAASGNYNDSSKKKVASKGVDE